MVGSMEAEYCTAMRECNLASPISEVSSCYLIFDLSQTGDQTLRRN
jgi:hypothetical protein